MHRDWVLASDVCRATLGLLRSLMFVGRICVLRVFSLIQLLLCENHDYRYYNHPRTTNTNRHLR